MSHVRPSAVLSKPEISGESIVACLKAGFGLDALDSAFLPSADTNSAVYRITGRDRGRFLLKLREGNFDETAIAIAAYLHARGIRSVLAPLPASANQLSIRAQCFHWTLYPFFEGKNGFEVPLSPRQWIALGETMRAVHSEILPAELGRRAARESFASGVREIVTALDAAAERSPFDDPPAAGLRAYWTLKRREIQAIVERAGQLARKLQQARAEFVLCHSDLHAGNVLLGAGDALAVVDWDEPIMAPKERDLMFIGGGVGGVWNDPREAEWFYRGYGPTAIDPVAIAYYRYERIVADLAAYGQRIFGAEGSMEDREESLRRVINGFQPGNVVEMAHNAHAALA
jgi:spectinomycin phosphotransferase